MAYAPAGLAIAAGHAQCEPCALRASWGTNAKLGLPTSHPAQCAIDAGDGTRTVRETLVTRKGCEAVTPPLGPDPARLGASKYAPAGAASLPVSQTSYSCVYMPLLLDAAGLLHAETRATWPVHPVFGHWLGGSVNALLAHPILTARSLQTAAEHVHATTGYARRRSAFFQMVVHGTCFRRDFLVSPNGDLARPANGLCVPGPLQEVLLASLLGENEDLALVRPLDEMRQGPAATLRLGVAQLLQHAAHTGRGPQAVHAFSQVEEVARTAHVSALVHIGAFRGTRWSRNRLRRVTRTPFSSHVGPCAIKCPLYTHPSALMSSPFLTRMTTPACQCEFEQGTGVGALRCDR